jgi:hypothetical protein
MPRPLQIRPPGAVRHGPDRLAEGEIWLRVPSGPSLGLGRISSAPAGGLSPSLDDCPRVQLVTTPASQSAWWQVPARRSPNPGGSGRFQNKCEMKLPWDPRLRELVALAMLAAFGCGLAAAQGDLLFVALFGAASVVAIIEAIRRLR